MARVLRSRRLDDRSAARRKRIASVAGRTRTDRNVIDDLALRLKAACARARIAALAAHAGAIARTVGAAGALGSTLFVRIALVLVDAGALAVATDRVRAARRRIARIGGTRCLGDGRLERALGERITGVAGVARADGHVSQDLAFGLEAARAGARIATLLIDARLIAGTVRIEDALGPATGRRSDEVLQARAGRMVAHHLAARIGTARRWRAGGRRWERIAFDGWANKTCTSQVMSELD